MQTNQKNSFQPLDKLLLLCARIDITPGDQEEIKRILGEKIDFELLLQKSYWHRISVLVARTLMLSYFRDLIPAELQTKLKEIRYHNLARNIVLQDELTRILTLFKNENINAIVLKGAALLDSVYKDISLRPMGDLDILIEEKDLLRAEELVLQQGYQYRVSQQLQDETREDCRHLANLWHKEKNVMLEIHHHIVSPGDPYYFDIEGFRVRAQSTTISGSKAPIFSPVDMLLHLTINFLLDRRFQSVKALGQLCDISEIIKHYGDKLDWDLLEKTAKEYRLTPSLHFVLYACEQLFGTPVPHSFMHSIEPSNFNPQDAGQFIRRRVLDTKPWLAHGLADSGKTLPNKGAFIAIISRLRKTLAAFFKDDKGAEKKKLTLREIFKRSNQVLFHPSEFRQDLQLDRWLHNLQHD